MITFKTIFKALGMILLLLLVYAITQGTVTAAVMKLYYFFSTGSFDVPSDAVSDGIYYSAMALGLILSSLAIMLFLHLTRFFRLRSGIFRSIKIKPLLFSTGLVFSSIFALNIFVQLFPLEDNLKTEFNGLSHNIWGAVSIAIIAPLLEEVFFRGAMQGYLLRRFEKPWLAILLSALVFGVFHLNPVQVVYATLLGIVLGWIYYRTGSLLSVIVGHVLNNTLATFTLVFLGGNEATVAAEGTLDNSIFSLLYTLGGFVALSVFFSIKLHRSLPAPPVPWHESDEKPDEETVAG